MQTTIITVDLKLAIIKHFSLTQMKIKSLEKLSERKSTGFSLF